MMLVLLLLSGVFGQISPLGLIEQPPLQCSQEGLSCSVQVKDPQKDLLLMSIIPDISEHLQKSNGVQCRQVEAVLACGFNVMADRYRPNCSVKDWVKRRSEAPSPHPIVDFQVKTKLDERGETVPVLSLILTLFPDANVYSLQGIKVQVHEFTTNNTLYVCYIFNNSFSWIQRPDFKPWSFALDQIVVDPGMTYQVSVSNLPKPDVGEHEKLLNITIPGCEHHKLRRLRVCLENGSLWDPNMTWLVRDDQGNSVMIKLIFNTAEFSDMYKVYIHSADFHTGLLHTVSKDNLTSVSVNFSLDIWWLSHCEFIFGIKPFFIRCREKCSHHQQKVNICSYYTIQPTKRQHIVWTLIGQAGLLFFALIAVVLHNRIRATYTDTSSSSHNTMDKSNPETIPALERSKVLIIYSQDHPMYTDIVLKLCAFLRAKCGTEVTLDLLDSTCLSTVGSIQWLDMQRKRLASTSDKILILCSPGVCAKWNAMCGGRRVMTREDIRSPMGDMLTPALSLIIPEFLHALSFGKYAVAYFDDVCSEKDVPALFHVAVRYQLMKQFEELFFRLLNKEKYEPGSIKHIDSLGGDDYYSCPSGKALRDAIKEFQAFQLTNPNWFEIELVDVHEEVEDEELEQEDGTKSKCYCILQSELQVKEITAPVLANIVKGQMHEAKQLLI